MFSVAAVVLFVIVALGLTAYLGFTSRVSIDTEEVTIGSAERFGRFEMPASATRVRLRARGSPLEGDLFARFTIDPVDLPRLIDSTPLRTPLRADPRLAARAASLADKPWWTPPMPSTRAAAATRNVDRGTPSRPTAAPPLTGLHTERGFTLLLVLDTSDPAKITVYLHATNR